MVNKKQILFSFIIPFFMAIVIPPFLLWLVEGRSLMTILSQNFFFLIIGLVILGFGLILFIECNWLFYTLGKGTLAPIPKIETISMVIKGPYKHVRNPMILSVIMILLAESFLVIQSAF